MPDSKQHQKRKKPKTKWKVYILSTKQSVYVGLTFHAVQVQNELSNDQGAVDDGQDDDQTDQVFTVEQLLTTLS